MGNTLLNSGVVCRDDKRCNFVPNPDGDNTSLTNSLAGFVGQMSKGAWQVCVADLSSRDIGVLKSATLDLTCGPLPSIAPTPIVNVVPTPEGDVDVGDKPEGGTFDVWLPVVIR